MAEPGIRCFIGLGSNLRGPRRQLQAALGTMRKDPELRLAQVSPFYRSLAIGLENQPDYCNAVVEVITDLEAARLLERLLAVELQQGRNRKSDERWGPRILDLDLLLYGDHVIQLDHLRVPHPEMHRRNFVMRPLADIAPEVVIPDQGTVAELADRLGDRGLEPWTEAE